MTNGVVQVINVDNHIFQLNEEELKHILLRDEVKDRYVCVVSIAGSFRKGKSFMLNLFLRYLYAKYVHFNVSNWLGDENSPLKGFSWSCGSTRNTIGMLMWSDVFLYDNPNGDKIAILLLDTQGIFDHQSTTRDCVTIFALATMLSSVTIYNVSQNIQEDDLRNLELFVEYGRMALTMTNQKPFQRLQFLVRDWQYPDEIAYGEEGGARVISDCLKVTRGQNACLQSVRENIKSCFDEISCFLMPHPECIASSSSKFDGCLKDVDAEFKENLKRFVPLLLSPDKLICKEINGERISASMLVNCFKSYVAMFQGDKLPEPSSLMNTTMELFVAKIIQDFMSEYQKIMVNIFMNDYLTIAQLNENQARVKSDLLNKFNEKVISVSDKYQQVSVLGNQIDSLYNGIFKKIYEKSEKEQKNLWEELRNEMQSKQNELKARAAKHKILFENLKASQNEIREKSKYWNEELEKLQKQAREKQTKIIRGNEKKINLNQPSISKQQNEHKKQIANLKNRFDKEKVVIDDKITAVGKHKKCLQELITELTQEGKQLQKEIPQSAIWKGSSEDSIRNFQLEDIKLEIKENNKKIDELHKDEINLLWEREALTMRYDERIKKINSQIAKYQKKDNNESYNQLQERENYKINQTLYELHNKMACIKDNLSKLESENEAKEIAIQNVLRILNEERTLMSHMNETALKNKLGLL